MLLTQATSEQAVQLHSKTYSVGTKPFYISNKVHNTLVNRTVPSTYLTSLITVPIGGILNRKQPYSGSHLMTKTTRYYTDITKAFSLFIEKKQKTKKFNNPITKNQKPKN